MTLETKAAFARRLNWNRSNVTRAGHAGRLLLTGGLVDIEASLAQLNATDGHPADVAARHSAEGGQGGDAHSPAAENPATAPHAPRSAENEAAPTSDTDGAGRARYKAITLQFEN